MAKNNWHKIFTDFRRLNVLVVGDVMVDNYMWGKVNRISPEAPVPVVSVEKKESRLGGAANVALNIQALGATPVLCSLLGNDVYGNLFVDLLKKNNLSREGIISTNQRVTTVKTRVIAHSQQLLRVDEEHENSPGGEKAGILSSRINKILRDRKIDIIVFEDYDKGAITEELISTVFSTAGKKNIPVAVDPKKRNFNFYEGACIFKPNFKELIEGTKSDISHSDIEGLTQAAVKLRSSKKHDTVLLTLSDKGMLVCNNSIEKLIPAHVRQIADVSGAGDTVISVAALCFAAGCPAESMAGLANLAGGLVCEQVGVVPVNCEQLKREAIRAGL